MSLDIEGVLSAHIRRLDTFSYHCACGQWRDKRDDGTGHAAHVAAVLREQIDGAIIAATVGALQYAAGLADAHENDELAGQLSDAARNTEAQSPADWWCCPVCEEVTCDEGCPLEPIRGHLSDTERAGGAE